MTVGVPRAVRNTLISVVVVVVVLVGGGVAYTYFLGPDNSQSTVAAPTVAPPADPIAKPPKMAENAKESASIQTLTSPIAPGSNALLSVRTNPGSKCTVTVVYNNVPSTDSGLAAKVADEYGTVSWSWTVGSSVPLGKWPVKVTCAYKDRSAVVQGDLVVAKQAAGDSTAQ
jgi:hypothetical protein